jgi:quinol monooxygenase YgiN
VPERRDVQELLMQNEISWRVKLTVRTGQFDNFEILTGQMVEFARTEAGVLSYERFITDDGKYVHVYGRYVDSAAALVHLQEFRRKFADRFSSMVDRKEFTVFGNPSSDLKAVLDEFGTLYLRYLGDFKYWS